MSAFACRCLSEDYFTPSACEPASGQVPGSDDVSRGLGALSGAAEQLFRVLPGWRWRTWNGFVDLVNAIGGLTIDIPEPIDHAAYPNPDGSDLASR